MKKLKEKLNKSINMADQMVLIGIFLAFLYWGLESLLNFFSPEEINFYRQLFGPNVSEMWLRVIVLCLFMIFGSHVQFTINKRKQAERDLLDSYRKLQNARMATILGLAKLAEYRDEGTGTHLERIREYAKIIAQELAKNIKYRNVITPDYIEDIYQSAILHDIGKVGIPDAVLLKPDKLTDKEFEIIKRHTILGGDAIKAIEYRIEGRSFLEMGKEIAYNHHEKWDGSGYPAGLKGDEIPLSARIVALADVYDALTTERFYKRAYTHEKSSQIIIDLKAVHFDPAIVDVFLQLEDEFKRIRQELIKEETGWIELPAQAMGT
ncbi:MAG: HD domain-containing protein [Deltaproteobacteria bacterium]|nr:HD domain-containing protein [Deltaproteobacteria bacterium]